MVHNPALIIIYNHYHPDNVARLENIYGGRFTHIYHLMPYLSGPQNKTKQNKTKQNKTKQNKTKYHSCF